MLSANNTIITHDKIIAAMEGVGHQDVKKGICNGLAQMWIQAVLCGEPDEFIARLYLICTDPNLLQKIAAAQAKKGQKLTREDLRYLSVLAFFDGVQLYQNFRHYTHLFKTKPHHLDAAAIAELVLPIKLEKNPIVEIFSDNQVFNIFSFQNYLNQLAKEFALYEQNRAALKSVGQPLSEVVIALHSCNHKVALRYKNKTACWELADANQYEPFDLPSPAASAAILLSLTDGLLSPVNVSIFTTKDNMFKKLMQDAFTRLSEHRKVKQIPTFNLFEKYKRLLLLTAMRGDEKKFIKVAKKIPNQELWEPMLNASITALYHGQTGIIDIIMREYHDCLMLPDDTQRFLRMAITNRQNDLIAKLMRLGADVDKPYKGQRPLHMAIVADNLGAAKELIALGADPNLPNLDNDPPLIIAVKLRRFSILDYLAGLKTTKLEETDLRGNTALIIATQLNSSSACEILLKHKANPNNKNSDDETAVFVACQLEYIECLFVLLKYNANLEIFDKFGCTPLFKVVVKENWNMAAMILLNLKSLDSFNPFSFQLTMAAMNQIIKFITEHLAAMSDGNKNKFLSDVTEGKNAMGMMLVRKPKTGLYTFFKNKEAQIKKYQREIRSACKPTCIEDVASRGGYIRA